MRLCILLFLILVTSCRTIALPPVEIADGVWVLAEDQGQLAFVWMPGFRSVEARGWIEHRSNVGDVGVVEAWVISPEPGRRFRFHAEPVDLQIKMLSSPTLETTGLARFEYSSPVQGWVGIRITAERMK